MAVDDLAIQGAMPPDIASVLIMYLILASQVASLLTVGPVMIMDTIWVKIQDMES